MRAPRVILVALLLMVIPVLAAGCISPRDSQDVRTGTCEDVAYGWVRYVQPVEISDAEQGLKSLGYETRQITEDVPENETWVVFRAPAGQAADPEGDPGGAVGLENGTSQNFRGILRVFTLVSSDNGTAAPDANASEDGVTMIAVVYDPPRAQRQPISVPLETQQAQLDGYLQMLNRTVAPALGLPQQAETTFQDTRSVCPGSDVDDLGLDYTPEGERI